MRKLATYILFFLSFIMARAQSWTQKSNVGGPGREYAVAFSIGNKGYVSTGLTNSLTGLNDLWEYDSSNDNWVQKASLPGVPRCYAVAFSIGNKGYVGTGDTTDFWEWNQATDTWTKRADFPGGAREMSIAFSIGTKGYIGLGGGCCGSFNDLWEWDGDTLSSTFNTWTQRANFIGGSGTRVQAVCFTIGKRGYVATGMKPLVGYKELWEYDGDVISPTYNTWIQRANFGGTGRNSAAGFAIGLKGYVGTGEDGDSLRSDFWEWDQPTDTWTQKPRFRGTARFNSIGMSIGNKGYIGTGYLNQQTNYGTDFWEYCDTCPMIGIEKFNSEAILYMYPNPATNWLYIEKFRPMDDLLQITLIDAIGKTWSFAESKETRIPLDVSTLQNGIYFVCIKTNEGTLTKKIIVQH